MAAPATNLQEIPNLGPELAAVMETSVDNWLEFNDLTTLFNRLAQLTLSEVRLGPEPLQEGLYHYIEPYFSDNYVWDPVNQPRRLNCESVRVPGGGQGINATFARRTLPGDNVFSRMTYHRHRVNGPHAIVHYRTVPPLPVVVVADENAENQEQNNEDEDNHEHQGQGQGDQDDMYETESDDDDDVDGDPDYVPSGSESEDEIDFDEDIKTDFKNYINHYIDDDAENKTPKPADYIDTEGTFRPDRIVPIAERFGMDSGAVLDNVIYARAYTYEHQYNLLLGLAAKMSEEAFKILNLTGIKG